mmetsp:Transcript_116443/g.276759  ORF Transcript_116443/g.276759 Transcript_116443/m.276759 type:complete len:221 (-) Transcript_116443:572-1234(-)
MGTARRMPSLMLLKPPCVTKTWAWLSAATWSKYRRATTLGGSSPSISTASSLGPTARMTRTSERWPKNSISSLQSRWLNCRPVTKPVEDTCSGASQRLSTVMLPRDTTITLTPAGTSQGSSPASGSAATRGSRPLSSGSVDPTQRKEELTRRFSWCFSTTPCSSGIENTRFLSGLKNRQSNCDSKTSTPKNSLAISLAGRKPGLCAKDWSKASLSCGFSA